MESYQKPEQFPKLFLPLVLTIGSFDGVHLGHQYVIGKTVKQAKACKGKSVLFTFSNHPSEVIPGRSAVSRIYSSEQKTALLSTLALDYLIQLPFTLELSRLSAHAFMQLLRTHIPFQSLVLGYDARFGKNREGGRELIFQMAQMYGFTVEYMEPVVCALSDEEKKLKRGENYEISAEPISSRRIRKAISQANFLEAEKLLGRPFSILSTLVKGDKPSRAEESCAVITDLSNLCLPPFGFYEIVVKIDDQMLQGIGNLRLERELEPVFEVCFGMKALPLLGKKIEIFPKKLL